jgi:two-component system heavy metal sensor histidine kinase CusS
LTFRSRLVAAVSAMTFVTLGVAFVAVSVAVNHAQERRLDEALLEEAEKDAQQTSAREGEPLVIRDMPMPAANDVGPLTKYGAIYDRDGAVRAKTSSFGDDVPSLRSVQRGPHQPFDFWHGREHLRGVIVPLSSARDQVLLVAAQRVELDGDAAFLRRAMTVAFVMAVFWASLVASFIVSRLTRDHRKIAEVAQRVAAGDLAARVESTSGDPELAKLGRNIDEMIARLEVLVESQQRFIALAAHELRLPLTTLYGELALALRRSRDAESYRAAIGEALDSTRKLKHLAEDLLTIARIGADHLGSSVASARDVVHAAESQVLGQARERGVVFDVTGDDCAVLGDAGDLERLVRNLLENAVRHSQAGGHVSVAITAHPERIHVTVSDEGSGIAEGEREKIFEPFYRGRGETERSSDGAGLGLAIVRQIARAHGGDVVLVDTPSGQGARFEVTLRRADEPALDNAAIESGAEDSASPEHDGHARSTATPPRLL